MNKVIHIAWREFSATVLTKGFLIGMLLPPIIMFGSILAQILLANNKPPPVKGTVALIDNSGAATETIKGLFTADSLDKEASDKAAEISKAATEATKAIDPSGASAGSLIESSARNALVATAPTLSLETKPTGTDVEALKKELLSGSATDGSRLAVVVIAQDAILKSGDKNTFGSFDVFVKERVDARAQDLIVNQVRTGIINARLAANGEEPSRVRELMTLDRPRPKAITAAGEKSTGEFQQVMIPLAMMILLWISTFTGGQYLLTSTIEEKSNRIMEVLLSAVSPVQLMTGKIVGQMGAGLLILLLYSGAGIGALFYFARSDLVHWHTLGFLVIFFFIMFFTIGAMMAAVGSAVSDVHEAQTLIGPIMIVIISPMLLMMPIIQSPNSNFAVAMSFIPPINPFVMILRLASTQPPPMWQVLLSTLIGCVTVVVAVRSAAKIFRIGVLMYGKPPNFATLIRWIRMA
jgi:ABC-2 type transport system permease protein